MTYRIRCKRAARTRELRAARFPYLELMGHYSEQRASFMRASFERFFCEVAGEVAKLADACEPGATAGRYVPADPPRGFRISIDGYWTGNEGGEP